ncbi:MAG: hypothetical protein WCC12_01165 [Anaerolineales bacterium]
MITAAVEDILSEAVLRRVIEQINKPYTIGLVLSGNGKGYLKTKASGFNSSAKGSPFLLLVDQDTKAECPPALIASWLNKQPCHHNLVFRVAVMEIEAWVMADRAALSSYLGVTLNKVPADVEAIADPKRFLVNLARSSRSRTVRDDLVPREQSTARVGPNYNGSLIQFVQAHWQLGEARRNAPSLEGMYRKLMDFKPEI